MQLIEIYNNILNNLDNKRNSRYIFLDISKAFDRVWIRALRGAVICGEFCGYRNRTAFAVRCGGPQEDELRCGAVAVD